MDIGSNDWTQVWGDADPCKHGGVFAQMDGDAVQLFSLEPVRAAVGDREAAEVGFTFWKSEGYYDPSDLKWGDTAKSVLRSIGAEDDDDEAWYARSRVERAVLHFEQGYGKEPALERSGGFTEDLFGDEVVVDQNGYCIRLSCLGEDDEFRQEILGKFEVFVWTHASAGKPDNEPFLALGRQAAAEWVKVQVPNVTQSKIKAEYASGKRDSDDFTIIDEDKAEAEWRGSLLSVATSGLYRVAAEIYHVFDVTQHGTIFSRIGHEAVDALVEAYNEGTELAKYLESQGGDYFYSDEALELLEGAPR